MELLQPYLDMIKKQIQPRPEYTRPYIFTKYILKSKLNSIECMVKEETIEEMTEYILEIIACCEEDIQQVDTDFDSQETAMVLRLLGQLEMALFLDRSQIPDILMSLKQYC
jgi:hypothetical protein